MSLRASRVFLANQAPSERPRAQFIAGAGIVIILISAAAALLPRVDEISGAMVMGAMMITAGIVEISAGYMRPRNRDLAMLPAGMTILAGALLAVHPLHRFVPSVWLVIAWLGARGVVLGAAASAYGGSVRAWTVIAAGMDLGLGGILTLGLSASTLTLTFFGNTPEIIRGFSWVLALSFVATGMLLLEVAACESEGAMSG